jgi:hypothetical protein
MKAWYPIDSLTSILLDGDEPLEVRTTARDLDRALDSAAQWYGESLEEICGGWRFGDNDPQSEAVTRVACSADLHEEYV